MLTGLSCQLLTRLLSQVVIATPVLPAPLSSEIPFRDLAQVSYSPRDKVRLLATLVADAVPDGLVSLHLLRRRIVELSLDHEAHLTMSGILYKSTHELCRA